jgi:hypothetical protein
VGSTVATTRSYLSLRTFGSLQRQLLRAATSKRGAATAISPAAALLVFSVLFLGGLRFMGVLMFFLKINGSGTDETTVLLFTGFFLEKL